MPEPAPDSITAFLTRWQSSGGHERGAGHQFLLEFCDLLSLGKPDPPVAGYFGQPEFNQTEESPSPLQLPH